MLVRLYRCLPESWRKSIYTLFLGKILFFIRHPKLVGQNIQLKHQFRHYLPLFCGQTGIEIGGPSAIFAKGQLFPVYEVCKRVDGCNFASVTVWEGEIKDTIYRYQETALGWQYIGEATEMPTMVPSGTYDFVISSGCLEHVANPIKALKAWLDILKSGGILLLVVPNKKNNFDHRRPDTPFDHLLQDYQQQVTEADNTHYEEIISLHDLALDPRAGDPESFRKRCINNQENRCFHHHVFHPDCLIALFDYCGMIILSVWTTESDHIILARKP